MRPRSNRQNEFSQFVEQSTLDAEVRHQLHFVNRRKAWFGREPLIMKDGTEIPQSTRRLARQIMQRVLSRHRKPDFSRIGMVLDQRAARLREAERSTEFNLWIRLSTLDRGRPIEIPLKAYDYFRERRGTRKKSIQVNERDGRLYFGVVTDISPSARPRNRPTGPGRKRSARLWAPHPLCHRPGRLAGPRLSPAASPLRLANLEPGRLPAEAWAQNPQSSLRPLRAPEARLPRGRDPSSAEPLGRGSAPRADRGGEASLPQPESLEAHEPAGHERRRRIVEEKLRDLHERFGVEIERVNPAYSSQTCSVCEYVDPNNRTGEHFRCRWCGRTLHADVNAA